VNNPLVGADVKVYVGAVAEPSPTDTFEDVSIGTSDRIRVLDTSRLLFPSTVTNRLELAAYTPVVVNPLNV
jgi:hypothetical protein